MSQNPSGRVRGAKWSSIADLRTFGLVALLATVGCGGRTEAPAGAAAGGGAAVPVQAVEVGAEVSDTPLILGGRLKADEEVTVAARIAGRLSRVPVADGGTVRRGAAVAVFAAPDAEAARAAAQSAASAAQVRYEVARRQAARLDTLFAAGVATRRERELAGDERDAAEAGWHAAQAAATQATQSLTVEAPFDGVVVRHLVDPGASVMPGQPLLALRSVSAREVVVAVPDAVVPAAATAAWEVQDRDGAWHAARLARLDGASDPTTRSRFAYLTPDGIGATQPGDFVRVRVRGGAAAAESALRVPPSAVLTRGELTGVFVLRDGHAWLRWVHLGHQDGDTYEVLSGLTRGDRIARVAAGLTDGAPITVAP